MDDVANKAYQEFLDLQGWDELSIDDREYKELKVKVRAVSNYRASLVGLVPLEAGSGNTAPGEPSASWQLNDLATVCTESYQSVKWFIKNFPRGHRQVVVSQFSGAPRMTEGTVRFVRPQNIVCPRIPKPESGGSAGFPVFEYTAFLPGTELDTFYEVAQAVNVPRSNSPTEDDVSFWNYPNVPADVYPTLHQCCPELVGLEKIAFIYEPREAFASLAASLPHMRRRPMHQDPRTQCPVAVQSPSVEGDLLH
jgi:hypothetical protein